MQLSDWFTPPPNERTSSWNPSKPASNFHDSAKKLIVLGWLDSYREGCIIHAAYYMPFKLYAMHIMHPEWRQSFFHRFPQIKTAKFSIKELKKIVKFRSSHLCSPIEKYFERFPNLLHKRDDDEILSFGSIQSNNFCLHLV